MAWLVFEENAKVHFVASIADISAPTVAEMAAGTDLTSWVMKDGIQPGVTNNRVTDGTIDTAFDAELMGSWGAQMSLRLKTDDTTDTGFSTLGTRGTTGHIVIAQYGDGLTAADKVRVFPIETGAPVFPQSATNTKQTWTCEMAVTSAPDLDSAVVA